MAESQIVFIQIPRGGFRDLAAVAENADRLGEIVELAGRAATQADLSELVRSVSEHTGIPASDTRAILDGLSTMRGLMERWKLSADVLFDSLQSSIEAQATESWKNEHLPRWKQANEKIVSALNAISSESPISIQHKARELTYAHQNILTDASLLTDLRPVYNAGGDKILAMVLTHKLTVSYQDGQRQQRIEFALDAADLVKLFKSIERAQLKTETARESFKGQPWDLIIAGTKTTGGEEDDEG